MKTFIVVLSIFFSLHSHSLTITKDVEDQYLSMGGNTHALSHLKCFLAHYEDTNFDLRDAHLSERCNGMSNGKKTVQINSFNHVTLVDYTKPSSQKRLYILDLNNPSPPFVESYYVSHGRYKNTPYTNANPGIEMNTVEWIKYYSNVKRSNATSSGFYITGQKYQGRWRGPKGDKYSLIVHGIHTDRNDNACDRAVVLHGNGFIKETGSDEGVRRMSSGCFMLDYDLVNSVIQKIRGGGGDHHKNEDRLGGTVLFAYGETEANENSHLYCSSEGAKRLRIQ